MNPGARRGGAGAGARSAVRPACKRAARFGRRFQPTARHEPDPDAIERQYFAEPRPARVVNAKNWGTRGVYLVSRRHYRVVRESIWLGGPHARRFRDLLTRSAPGPRRQDRAFGSRRLGNAPKRRGEGRKSENSNHTRGE